LSYDIKTIGAIIDMASTRARNELIQSAFAKRDYEFLDAIYETSGLMHLNAAANFVRGSLSLETRSFDHPFEIAVIDNDPVLLSWALAKKFEVRGNWFSPANDGEPPALSFPALEHAFVLKRKSMLEPLLAQTDDSAPDADFIFSRKSGSIKFEEANAFGIAGPAGNTPLTCALVNGWDDLVGKYLPETRRTHELDLMMAVKNDSAHVGAIAAKIGSLKFPESIRSFLSELNPSQRARHFAALADAGIPTEVKQTSFVHSVGSVEECAFLLDNKEICAAFVADGLDPLHHMLGSAVKGGRLDIVKWLVQERGANPNYGAGLGCLRSGFAPCVFECEGEMLEWLAQAGADVNEIIPTRGSVLMDAVKRLNYDKVGQLIMLGADTAMKYEGRSALQLAKDDKMRSVIRAARVGASVSTSVGSEASVGSRVSAPAAPL
jgi:hypothetical protein